MSSSGTAPRYTRSFPSRFGPLGELDFGGVCPQTSAMERRIEDHPYASFIHRVKKPAQYLGGETGEARKDWDGAKGRMCLAFPDLYEVGMSHLGFKILYGILNDHPALLAERSYAPWTDMEAELRARDEPLRTLESWRPLSEFDVVGFSLQFELTYVNVLTMLDLGGVPLRASARSQSDPLVIAGGPVATHAEPLAPFIDAFLIGDGEERTAEIVLTWSQLAASGMPRAERLAVLSQLEGVYVPSLYATAKDPETGFTVVTEPRTEGAPLPVRRTFVERLDDYPFPTGGPVAATETVFDRVSVEIARGCTEGCRFCQAGMIYRPVRERSPESILDTIEGAVREGGYDEASLTSLSTADYSAISPLVREVSRRVSNDNVSLSVSSLRAYGLGEDVLDELKRTRTSGLTFAPEAGTQRMRDVVNKNVTEEQLLETARRVFSRGFDKMKLYFMIGLPTEEDEDILGIVQTGARALEVGHQVAGRGRAKVTVSVSTHVPKPHTPFQWCAMDDHAQVLRKQALLREEARRTRVQLRMHDSKGSWLEGVLARGDRILGDVLESAWWNGARFDSWQERLDLEAWTQAFAAHDIDPAVYLGTIPVRARLPWDHIDVGLEEGFLAREYRKALKNRLSPPCGKAAGMFVHHTNEEEAQADSRRLVCYDCGVACDMSQMREERLVYLRTLGARTPPPPARPLPITPKKRTKGRQPPKRRDQGPAVKVRLGFTRIGRIAFSSHLDLVRLLPRIFRRSGLPLFYSEGFHPQPVMVFGPSLPVGTSSFAEYLDLKLCEAELRDVEGDLLGRLNRGSMEGLEFFGAERLVAGDPPVSRVIDELEYVAGLAPDAVQALGGLTAMRQTVDQSLGGDLTVTRVVKGIGKRVDVGSFLLEFEVGSGESWLRRAGIGGDLVPVRMRLRTGPSGTARAAEVLKALFRQRDLSARFIRVSAHGQPLGRRASPLELAAFRKPPSAQLLAPAE